MAWIESHDTLRDHPKVRKLARILGVPRVQVIGHLHCLWWWALSYSRDGDLSHLDDMDIAIGAEWEGNETDFVQALCDARFIDRDARGTHMHDWHDYAGKLIDRKRANADRMRAARAPHVQNTTNEHAPVVQSPSYIRAEHVHDTITARAGHEVDTCETRATHVQCTEPARAEHVHTCVELPNQPYQQNQQDSTNPVSLSAREDGPTTEVQTDPVPDPTPPDNPEPERPWPPLLMRMGFSTTGDDGADTFALAYFTALGIDGKSSQARNAITYEGNAFRDLARAGTITPEDFGDMARYTRIHRLQYGNTTVPRPNHVLDRQAEWTDWRKRWDTAGRPMVPGDGEGAEIPDYLMLKREAELRNRKPPPKNKLVADKTYSQPI